MLGRLVMILYNAQIQLHSAKRWYIILVVRPAGGGRMDRNERAAELAGEVIALAQSTLMVHLRFLDRALACLKPVCHEQLWFASDGLHLYYEPMFYQRKTAIIRELEQLTEEL